MNTPTVFREASGTSGMTAAMNGAVNLSTDDGWIPEFIDHGQNGFVIPKANYAHLQPHERDYYDFSKLFEILENEMLPKYYEDGPAWRQIIKKGMTDVQERFESNRMVDEYYKVLYK